MPVTEYGHRLATGIVRLALEGGRGRERPPDWSAHRRTAQTPGQPEITMWHPTSSALAHTPAAYR